MSREILISDKQHFFSYKCSVCDEGSGPFERVFQWAWYLEITKYQAQRKLPGACFD